jgi:hypothetical protein
MSAVGHADEYLVTSPTGELWDCLLNLPLFNSALCSFLDLSCYHLRDIPYYPIPPDDS